MLEHELGIYLKGHQTRIMSEIKRIIANDEIEEGEEITTIDDTILVRLGTVDRMARQNVGLACAQVRDTAYA